MKPLMPRSLGRTTGSPTKPLAFVTSSPAQQESEQADSEALCVWLCCLKCLRHCTRMSALCLLTEQLQRHLRVPKLTCICVVLQDAHLPALCDQEEQVFPEALCVAREGSADSSGVAQMWQERHSQQV